MMLEENAKKSLAMDAYKQAASLFKKRLKEKHHPEQTACKNHSE